MVHRLLSRALLTVMLLVPTATAAARPFDCSEPHGDGWYWCLGATEGRAGMVAELRSRSGDLDDAARWAGLLYYTEAAEPLRALLDDPPEEDAPWLLGHAATALAELEDASAVPRIVELARRFEGENWTVWEQAANALTTLGGPDATAYALDLAQRTTTFDSTWAANSVDELLPLLLRADAAALRPLLERWTADGGREGVREFLFARLEAARVGLGDPALLADTRRRLGTPDTSVPARPEFYVAALGTDPADIPSLVRMASSTSPEAREAYLAILRFADWLEAQGRDVPEGAAGERRTRELDTARKDLVARLSELTEYREDREHVQFEARQLALHHAALATLGDEDSRRRLVELIDDDVETVIPWLAAQYAVRLDLPEARDKLAKMVVRGTRAGVPLDLWETRAAFVDAVAPRLGADDASWSVLLLDTNLHARRRTLGRLARLRPPGACAAVADAVSGADDEAIEDAVLALSVLGSACRCRLETLACDGTAPERARLVSVEVLAMMRAPGVRRLIDLLWPITDLHAYLERARQILALPR
ncbi:MAG: hypothetical protein JXB32_25315 [Deltaproteobacteria bacterium]|nr:hypothetical protein [Deltaproteobacteria bacterium]